MTPELHERLIANSFDPQATSPDEFSAQVRSEIARWAGPINVSCHSRAGGNLYGVSYGTVL